MKRLLWLITCKTGIHKIFRWLHRHHLIILLYHGVDDEPADRPALWNYRNKHLPSAIFDQQLAYLKRHYNIIPLDLAIKQLQMSCLPPYSLAITFDDGYRNFFLKAYPVIKAHRAATTIFLTTDFVCRHIPLWNDRLEYANSIIYADNPKLGQKIDDRTRIYFKQLSDQDKETKLRQIEIKAGSKLLDFKGARAVYAPLGIEDINDMDKELISFGSHTKSHPILTKLTPKSAREEICESKRIVKSLVKNFSNVMSYPNGQLGDWDDKIECAVKEGGFMAALTTVSGIIRPTDNRFALKRLTMDGTADWPFFLATLSGLRVFLQAIKQKYA